MSADGRPTRVSSAIAATVAAVAVAALLSRVSLVAAPALLGVGGVVCLAAALGLAAAPDRAGAAVAASLLTVPAAAGIVAGTLGSGLSLVGAFFPAQTPAQLSTRALVLVGHVGVVSGCLLAVLGVALGARNVVDADSLREYYWLTVETGAVPVLAGLALAGARLLSTDDAAGRLLGVGVWLVSPGAGRTHLATLFALAAAAALAVGRALDALPVAELLADAGAGDAEDARVARARSLLSRFGAAAAAGALVALAVELPVEPARLRGLVGPEPYGLLVAVSTAGGPRWLCLLCLCCSLPAVAATWVLGRLARGSVADLTRRSGPVAGGALLTALAAAASGPVLDALPAWVASKLPGALGRTFGDAAGVAVAAFGPVTAVVGLTVALVAVTATVVAFLRLLLASGYVTGATAGYSLASGGLFLAAALAGVAGAGRWVVFAGLVGALVVWDLGRYGTVLGREVGREASTRTVELVHAGGSLAVGAVGLVVALGLAAVLGGGVAAGSTLLAPALVGALAGLVLLVEALR